jgi:hypothetical protein
LARKLANWPVVDVANRLVNPSRNRSESGVLIGIRVSRSQQLHINKSLLLSVCFNQILKTGGTIMSSSATTTAPVMPPILAANHFSLSGHGIHVDFSATSLDGRPLLSYHDSVRTLSFRGDDIRITEDPDLGSIVSVTLNTTVDVGSTSFTVLIPHVTVSGMGGSALVSTNGITTTHKTPFAPQLVRGQRDIYHVTHLTGTADHVVA